MTTPLKALVAALVVAVTAVACGPASGGQPAGPDDATPPARREWPASWPVPPLPVMWLEHPSASIWGSPSFYCWHVEDASSRVCDEFVFWSGVDAFPETVPGKQIPVGIESETTPDKVFVQVFTRHGNVMVDFLQLGPTYPVLDLDLDPGHYHIRVIGQWQYNDGAAYVDRRYNKVAYEFGLSLPGVVELIAECASTLIGGDISIALGSLNDRLRTAPDSANHAGCRFNKPIARVSLTLDQGAQSYRELFHIEPPSLNVSFPLPAELVSEKSGGPPPPGEYTRRMVAISENGDELEITTRDAFLETVTIAGR